MMTRRASLGCLAAVGAVVEKIGDGGFAEVTTPGMPARAKSVLPPYSGKRADFRRVCIGCGLCVKVCPEKVLKQSAKLATFGQPELDFRAGYCLSGCVRCSEVCPVGALGGITAEEKRDVRLGRAIWHKAPCIRFGAEGVNCTACVRKCPHHAITLVAGVPVVDEAKCTGCGACEHVCPSRPLPAIAVEGYEDQRLVRRMDEADLLDEMRRIVESGAASVVVAQGGVIVARESGRGLEPLLRLYARGALSCAIVFDKVVGRASAAVCAAGGAAMVSAAVMGDDAAQLLGRRGIAFSATRRVPQILDRARAGSCPMERLVAGCDDPVEMVKRIEKGLKK